MKRFLLILALVALPACSAQKLAVVPEPVVARAPSLDGNQANSGVISVNTLGFLCTPHFIDRWDGMLAQWGAKLTPPRKPGDRRGITAEGENFRFDAEAMADFAQLNQWRKTEEAP